MQQCKALGTSCFHEGVWVLLRARSQGSRAASGHRLLHQHLLQHCYLHSCVPGPLCAPSPCAAPLGDTHNAISVRSSIQHATGTRIPPRQGIALVRCHPASLLRDPGLLALGVHLQDKPPRLLSPHCSSAPAAPRSLQTPCPSPGGPGLGCGCFAEGIVLSARCMLPNCSSCTHIHGVRHLPQSISSALLARLTFFFTSELEGNVRLRRIDFLSLALFKKERKERFWLALGLMQAKEKARVGDSPSLLVLGGLLGGTRAVESPSGAFCQQRLLGAGS